MKNIPKAKPFIFTLIVVLATFKQSLFFGYYIAFTENFIENFCENKDKPELQCDGKCFLSDLIEKKGSDTPEIPNYVEANVVLYFFENIPYYFETLAIEKQVFYYSNHYQFLFSSSCKKPPSI